MSDTYVHAGISSTPLSPALAEAAAWSETAGAVVVFSGIVRNHDGGQSVERLSYTAHPSAEQVLRSVAQDIATQHPQVRIWVEHRIGELSIGDHALVAACASAHRAQAFAACAELIERIKAEVPVWKEQFYSDGTKDWVGL